MPVPVPDLRLPERSAAWRWWVCCLLLLATMINYMDRLTFNLPAKTIKAELGLDAIAYGDIESGFALAFAGGSLLFGLLVDRWNVFWVYPLALLAWSGAGLASGFATGFWSLLACRFLLGLAESSNWPCALRTTQRILPPGERSMGNSILQSGASVGALLTPVVLFALFDEHRPWTWRHPFWVVGAAGAAWVVFWWLSLRPRDLALAHRAPPGPTPEPNPAAPAGPAPLPRGLFARRLAVLIVLVVTINMTWHFLRAWLPLFLRERHGYTQAQTNLFAIAYYVCTDLGALAAGFLSLRLARRGVPIHAGRRLVFLLFALLTTLCIAAPFLPAGPVLVGTLLLVGFGSLGVFPNYYSFSQDLTVRHQGKLTGSLSFCCWMALAGWHRVIGQVVERTGSYTPCFIVSGLLPLAGFLALLLFWGQAHPPAGPPASPGRGAWPDGQVSAGAMTTSEERVREG
jgi:MFS transporter, ACS family, hexuronate transporter